MGSPCPSNLTGYSASSSGDLVEQADFTAVRNSINAEYTRRGIATTSWSSYSNPIPASAYNEMRNDINTKLGGTSPAGNALPGTVSVGDLIQASDINTLVARLDEWKVACPCNCDFCPCNCDFCPCNCDFCPCNCNFCPCNCNFCPCNCNFCPCNCNQGK